MSTQQRIVTFLTIILLLGIGGTRITFGQALLYKATTSGQDSNIEIAISKQENGYFVKVKNLNKEEMKWTCNTDSSFSVLRWIYYNPENGADISAERMGNTISITGQFKNKKYEEKLTIDDLPWYQDKDWGLGLKSFITSDKNSTCFWSINPKDLRIWKFEAKREKTEKIDINGREIESVYVKITFTGWAKLIWHGKMWFRKSDGTYVYSKMGKGPTAPVTTVQLIREK